MLSESTHDESYDHISAVPGTGRAGMSPNTWVLIYVALAFAGLFAIRTIFKGVK